jgi:hypothetical protein
MSSFTERLTLTQLDAELWETDREFSYYVGNIEDNDIITVQKGFITDCASGPFPFKMFIPVSGLYNQAAVLHDYLYATQIRKRNKADGIFREAMDVLHVPLWKANLMYTAVRLFGWLPWNHHKKHPLNQKTGTRE